jgi:hypothetical protein
MSTAGNINASFQSNADAQELLSKHVTHIRKDQECLQDAMTKQGNMIVGRWKKKSVAKRVDCLDLKAPTVGA